MIYRYQFQDFLARERKRFQEEVNKLSMNGIAQYDPGEVTTLGKVLTRPTITQNLEMKKAHLEEELKVINEALEALKANPDIEKLMNLVAKAQY